MTNSFKIYITNVITKLEKHLSTDYKLMWRKNTRKYKGRGSYVLYIICNVNHSMHICKWPWHNKMFQANLKSVTIFFFLGFSYYPKAEVIIFVLCLLMYLITLLGNIILISITILDSSLYTPMYFFLSNLSLFSCLVHLFCFPSNADKLCFREKHYPHSQGVPLRCTSLLPCAPLSVCSRPWWHMMDMWPSATPWDTPSSWTRGFVCRLQLVPGWQAASLPWWNQCLYCSCLCVVAVSSFCLWNSGCLKTCLCGHLHGAINHAGDHRTSCSYADAFNLYLLCFHPLQHLENQLSGWSKKSLFNMCSPSDCGGFVPWDSSLHVPEALICRFTGNR